MNRSLQLANRLREVLLSGKWIANTNYKDQINSVTWQEATKQIESFNTIALLTFHIDYYLGGLIQVLKGGELEIRDKYSFDAPEIKTEEDWTQLRNQFIKNAVTFCDLVEQLDDPILDQAFTDERYGTYLRNIEGVIEHAYYHLGQVSLIRKLVMKSS